MFDFQLQITLSFWCLYSNTKDCITKRILTLAESPSTPAGKKIHVVGKLKQSPRLVCEWATPVQTKFIRAKSSQSFSQELSRKSFPSVQNSFANIICAKPFVSHLSSAAEWNILCSTHKFRVSFPRNFDWNTSRVAGSKRIISRPKQIHQLCGTRSKPYQQ